MVDTVGKKLNQARTQKGITLDQAARATKMRPERILDLEDDNYNHFPNLAYAKGFLLLYAKYLGIDVSDFAESFRGPSRVGVEDYEYLNHSHVSRSVPIRREITRSSMVPLVAVAVALLVLVGGLVVFLFINFQRLPQLDNATKQTPPPATEATAPASLLRSAPPEPPELAQPDAASARALAPDSTAAGTGPSPIPPPIEANDEISAVGAPGEAAPSLSAAPAPGDRSWVANATRPATAAAIHELSLQPLKKTWVRIQKDDANSSPVFEDWLYPDARPLTFRGTKFWIKASESDALEIKKDGAPVRYQGSVINLE